MNGASELDDPLVFPVGHYMGPFHPKVGGAARHHIVRVGWDTPKLPDEAHLNIWALAHGLPARLGTVRWTRRAIIEAAHDARMPEAPAILDSLAGLGLIAEVTPQTPQARAFAASYRLQSLMIGLGNSPQDPLLDGIGIAGLPPAVNVRPKVHQVWAFVHLWPHLWAACEGLASVAAESRIGSPGDVDPQVQLDLILEATRTLISHNAVYLDLARTHQPGSG